MLSCVSMRIYSHCGVITVVVTPSSSPPDLRGPVSSPLESITMKRKPDLVMALVLVFGIGIVATGYAQALAGG